MTGLVKRSFTLAGHRTSVALEPEFWGALSAIATARGHSLSALVAAADRDRMEAGRPLASALRVLALSRRPAAVFTITQEDPGQPDVARLLGHAEAHSATLYPAESNHMLPLAELRRPHVQFLVVRDAHGAAVGTGAIARFGDWAELKRVWVEPALRGLGIARRLVDALAAVAGAGGAGVLRLETGVASHAALALYERAGFTRIGPFAGYAPDPLSVFMERTL